MTKKDKKWLAEGGERQITVACGGINCVNIDSVAGYCSNSMHRGYVTKTVLNGHNCIDKECKCFEKFDEFPYWIRKAQVGDNKLKRKQRIAKERDERIEKLNEYKQAAITLAEKYNFPINIISVRERSTKENEVYVFYVSDSQKNDTNIYKGICVDLRWKYPNVKFWIHRIIKPDGTCATMADLPKDVYELK
jgi:hypothetical protein